MMSLTCGAKKVQLTSEYEKLEGSQIQRTNKWFPVERGYGSKEKKKKWLL